VLADIWGADESENRFKRFDKDDNYVMRVQLLLVTWIILTAASGEARASGRDLLGLPSPVAIIAKPEDAARIALGRRLFFDKRLSVDGLISCSSCHDPVKAYADGRAFAQGVRGRRTTRNAPSLLNVAFNTSQFWDGRRLSLEDQALDPLLNPREHGLSDARDLLVRIRADAGYVNSFRSAFHVGPADITPSQVAQAIASFERSLLAGNSPFDRYFYAKERSALSAEAERGFSVFTGAAGCTSCHTIGESAALFTDQEFHNVNISIQKLAPRLADLTSKLVEGRRRGSQLDSEVLTDEDLSELGRFVVTLQPSDIGKFKTPSLRNVAFTAPYMHDGSVPTLDAAVDAELYRRGIDAGRPLVITPAERADLVEFLKALNSEELKLP